MDVKNKEKRLLLVDDDLIARIAFKSILGNSGYLIDEAENGKVAIDKFNSAQSKYDVILMDYNMPDMDGAAVTEELRKLEGNKKNIIIIGVTAQIDPKVKAICIKAGMNTVISKPVDINKLNKLIHEISKRDITK